MTDLTAAIAFFQRAAGPPPYLHDAIVRTRNHIAARGHTKNELVSTTGAYGRHRGALCLIGGFNLAIHGCPIEFAPSRDRIAFAQALGFDGKYCVSDLVNWNNAPERTIDEVLARLDKAANDTAPPPPDVPLPEPELVEA
jgi:hypothetical protein